MGTDAKSPFRQILAYTLYFDVLGYPRRGGSEEVSGRLYVGALWGLFLSGVFSGVLASELEALSFAAILLCFGAFLATIRILSDIGDGFLDPGDQAVLSHLPIASSTYFGARLLGLGVLLLFNAGHQAIVPAVVLSQTSSAGWWGTLAYFLSSVLMVASIAGLVILFHLLVLRWFSLRRLREWLVWAQVLGTSTTFGVIFLIPNLTEITDASLATLEGGLALWLPPLWFAHLFGLLTSEPSARLFPALLALIVPCLSAIPLIMVARGYQGTLSRIGSAPRMQRSQRMLADPIARWLSQEQQPHFFFALRNMRRDRGFRTRAYPLVIFPLVVLFLGRDQGPIFLVLMAYLPALYLPFFTAFLPYTDTPEGAWIFDSLPIKSMRAVQLGAHAALSWALIVPTYLLVFGLLSFVWEGSLAAIAFHCAMACAVASVFALLDIRSLPDLPFTKPFSPNILRPDVGAGIYVRLLLIGILGFVQASQLTTLPELALGFAVALGCVFLVRRMANSRQDVQEMAQ